VVQILKKFLVKFLLESLWSSFYLKMFVVKPLLELFAQAFFKRVLEQPLRCLITQTILLLEFSLKPFFKRLAGKFFFLFADNYMSYPAELVVTSCISTTFIIDFSIGSLTIL